MINCFTQFAHHKETGETFGVYSIEDEEAVLYLAPKHEWEDSIGHYDNEYICSTAYPAKLFNVTYSRTEHA